MDAVDGFARHCETTLPNSTCSYLAFGCLGCTRRTPFHLSAGTWAQAIKTLGAVGASAAEMAALRKAVDVALEQVREMLPAKGSG